MNISEIASWTLWLMLFLTIVSLQVMGYYNRVYIIYQECDQILTIEKTNQLVYKERMETLKTRIKMPGVGDEIKWDFSELKVNENNTMKS